MNAVIYGFSATDFDEWEGMEGVFTACTLSFGDIVLGDVILDGDGGADHYEFPTAKLNEEIIKQIPDLPEWCIASADNREPFALSYIVSRLADLHYGGGTMKAIIGEPIHCDKAIEGIVKC